jgi:hypothetical protein
VIKCPVCRNDALVNGYTESIIGRKGEEILLFYAYFFICDACGLELNDDEELKFVGIPTTIDRSDELYIHY